MATTATLPAALEDLVEKGLHAQRSGQFTRAAEQYLKLLEIAPNNFDGLQLLGLLRVQTGEMEEGLRLLIRAVEINPTDIPTLNNLGSALRNAGAYRDAVHFFHRALQVDPVHVTVLINLALTLLQVGEIRFASKCIDRAVAAAPDNPMVLYATAQLMQYLGQPRAAVDAYQRAIARGKNDHEAHHALGLALQDIGDDEAAWEPLRAAERERPTLANRLYRAYAALQCARWDNFVEDCTAFAAASVNEALDPLRLLLFPSPGSQLRRPIERYANTFQARGASLEPPGVPLVAAPRRARVRIAYLSPDFREHPVGCLLAGMLPEHDRSRFEIYAYGWGPPDPTGTRARVAAACDRFQDVSGLTDQALIERVRRDEVDIAIDLAGFTAHQKLGVFGARVAPVQVNWLGYPGTTGVPGLDYICADPFIIPVGSEADFSEQVVRLPHTYLPYDRARPVARPRERKAYGLPERAVVLACFGQVRKINPLMFDAWASVLKAVPEAVLWLASTYAPAIENLRREAQQRGIAPERLIFTSWELTYGDYLARYSVVDLALDTFPYGSHSTAADALWAGCPLVSLAGNSFVSRVSGSVLRAAGLDDLVTDTLEEYRALVLALASDPGRLRAVRARLDAVRLSCPLFDTRRFVRGLERAFLQMHERRLEGLPPAAFDVTDEDPTSRYDVEPLRQASASLSASRESRERIATLVAEGLELAKAKRTAEAAWRFESALSVDPDCFDALQLLGVLRFRAGDLETGIAMLTRACAQQPNHAPTLNNLGNALREAGRLDEAIDAYRRGVQSPDPPPITFQNLGSALVARGDLVGAYEVYSDACARDPHLTSARAPRASLAQALSIWDHTQHDADLLSRADPPTGALAVDAGSLLALPLSPATLKRYADAFAGHVVAQHPDSRHTPLNRRRERPLRVAYLSGDFREHAVGYLVAPVFEAHDRSRVEAFGYGWGGTPSDAARARIAGGLQHFRDVSALSDSEVADSLRADGIDIAVDLMGYTEKARPAIFAARPAPLNVCWLGYPGTMGAGLMDYLVADEFIIPAASREHYAEQIIHLPHTYLPYDRNRRGAEPRERHEYGLPDTGVVLASFGPTRKLTSAVFDIWLSVLEQVPDAVLWLGRAEPRSVDNLRAKLSARGLSPERVIFVQPLQDNADHLARYQVADLALDTSPYGSHSTAADALWVGCPIVGLVGDTFASRVSGSILQAGGVPELVTQDLEDYRNLLIELAQDQQRRDALRDRLATLRTSCPLFDIRSFTSALESAFEAVWTRFEGGESPGPVHVTCNNTWHFG